MAILLKTASVRIRSIQIMQVRVQNKGKSVWKSRYDGDVSLLPQELNVARKAAGACAGLHLCLPPSGGGGRAGDDPGGRRWAGGHDLPPPAFGPRWQSG